MVSPSSYHFIRDLIIAPSVLVFIILFNCSFLLLISSWTKLVSNFIEPEVELSWFSRCCFSFSRISNCLFIFFLNLAPYFMDSPLIAVFTTSHNRFGFALIFLVTVSFIVFFIGVTNSNYFKWLQLSFQNPFPLSLTIGINLTLIKEWSDLYPGEMFEVIIFSVIPYETRKQSNRQKIGDGLFYTRYILVNLDAVIARCQQGLFLPSSSLLESAIFLFVTFWPPFYLSQV